MFASIVGKSRRRFITKNERFWLECDGALMAWGRDATSAATGADFRGGHGCAGAWGVGDIGSPSAILCATRRPTWRGKRGSVRSSKADEAHENEGK